MLLWGDKSEVESSAKLGGYEIKVIEEICYLGDRKFHPAYNVFFYFQMIKKYIIVLAAHILVLV